MAPPDPFRTALATLIRHGRLLAVHPGDDEHPGIEASEAEIERAWGSLDADDRRLLGEAGSVMNRARRTAKSD